MSKLGHAIGRQTNMNCDAPEQIDAVHCECPGTGDLTVTEL